MAVAVLKEVGDKCTGPVNNAPEVDVKHPLPILNTEFVRRSARGTRDACVVADKVGALEVVDGERQ